MCLPTLAHGYVPSLSDVLPKCKVQPDFVGFLSIDGVYQVVITIFKIQT